MDTRFILVGPAVTIEALHELLREVKHPFARIVDIHHDKGLFHSKWYATLDTRPVPALILNFPQDSVVNLVDLASYSPNMA